METMSKLFVILNTPHRFSILKYSHLLTYDQYFSCSHAWIAFTKCNLLPTRLKSSTVIYFDEYLICTNNQPSIQRTKLPLYSIIVTVIVWIRAAEIHTHTPMLWQGKVEPTATFASSAGKLVLFPSFALSKITVYMQAGRLVFFGKNE